MSAPWVRPLRSGPSFVTGADALAALVPDGSRISVGGFHFSRQPIRLVQALAARGPRGLTHVNWGGSLGLEILLEADAIDHLVFCFSSLELFGTAPNFRRSLESGRVTHEEYAALELHHALLAAEMNLPTLPLQTPLGSWRASPGEAAIREAPPIDVDVILLHAQRADRLGNVEISSAQGLDRTLALAGRRVLVTVEEIVEPGTFRDRAAFIPRQFIEAIAVEPGGAWPTSCLPFYGPDFEELGRRVATGRFAAEGALEPGPSGRCDGRLGGRHVAGAVSRRGPHDRSDGRLARAASRRSLGVFRRLGLVPCHGRLPGREGESRSGPVARDAQRRLYRRRVPVREPLVRRGLRSCLGGRHLRR